MTVSTIPKNRRRLFRCTTVIYYFYWLNWEPGHHAAHTAPISFKPGGHAAKALSSTSSYRFGIHTLLLQGILLARLILRITVDTRQSAPWTAARPDSHPITFIDIAA